MAPIPYYVRTIPVFEVTKQQCEEKPDCRQLDMRNKSKGAAEKATTVLTGALSEVSKHQMPPLLLFSEAI